MNILISGVAGDIGFGIARILREWGVFHRLHGIDIHADHYGEFVLDECAVAPSASEGNYINWLGDYIAENDIKVFIPSSEAEIRVLAQADLDKLKGATILRNSNFNIQKSLDKFECLSYLQSCGIIVPANGLVGSNNPEKYPIIVKPRSGQGSKGLSVANSFSDFKSFQKGWVWQDYLLPDNEEYTCPVYSSPAQGMRILIIKRKLQGGLTSSGVVVENPEIEKYVTAVVEAMQVKGCINVQLRMTKRGPLLFEINPRLSSTLVFRDKMGFRDLRWWLSDTLGLAIHDYHPPPTGTRFYRGVQEYISLA